MKRIGITERGDAGLNLMWAQKLNTVDAAVIISKNITSPAFKNALINAHNAGHKLILHVTCTGLGHSALEPNVPDPDTQINALQPIIDAGFPIEQVVLRVDPILPSDQTIDFINIAKNTANKAVAKYPSLKRIRISIMDLHYSHLRDRFRIAGLSDLLPHTFKSESYLDDHIKHRIIDAFTPFVRNGIAIETCAEPLLTQACSEFETTGCVSNKDLAILGLDPIEHVRIGAQRPGACCCLPKIELLEKRGQCPHKCLYCFWR